MQIHGFNKTTLLDYPGCVAATIFFGGCNFRCPFCHNGYLVLQPDNEPTIPMEEIYTTLQKRIGILDGVCITGGEPTLQPELPAFLKKIKEYGYKIKLDTNGSNPQVIKDLYRDRLIDFVAMDIKSSRQGYMKAIGLSEAASFLMDRINESIDYLMNSGIDYEFRTTVVKGIHTAEDFTSIASRLEGCKAYFLQSYKDNEFTIAKCLSSEKEFSSFSKDELMNLIHILEPKIPNVALRGVD